MDILLPNVVSAVVFAALGMLLLGVAFWVLDKATPGDLWTQLCGDRGTGVSIFLGAVMLGLAIIIAAAIH